MHLKFDIKIWFYPQIYKKISFAQIKAQLYFPLKLNKTTPLITVLKNKTSIVLIHFIETTPLVYLCIERKLYIVFHGLIFNYVQGTPNG